MLIFYQKFFGFTKTKILNYCLGSSCLHSKLSPIKKDQWRRDKKVSLFINGL